MLRRKVVSFSSEVMFRRRSKDVMAGCVIAGRVLLAGAISLWLWFHKVSCTAA